MRAYYRITLHTEGLMDHRWKHCKSRTIPSQEGYNGRMKRLYQTGNILSLGFALVMNFLVGAQILDVPSIGEVSDRYATLLTPATYAFSIWSLIYALLVAFVVYQARDIFKPDKGNELPQKMGVYFIVASILNGLWTYVFVSEQILLSVGVLAGLVISLFVVLYRLNIARDTPTLKTAALVWWPLLIYAGWVTVACVVNVASWLKSINIELAPIAAVTILSALFAGLVYLLVRRNMRELLLASAWGIAAIGVQQLQINDRFTLVAVSAFTVAALLVVAVFAHGLRQARSGRKPLS